ncbi:MAG TPA: putative 2-aminoethylphosphonate ABC transporter permease subunit, partial [Burkholderiales bacterium]|nr:putative 2-aminoethylphosphonate ABC transporter permease subunit [Burkholderiales bacterium]
MAIAAAIRQRTDPTDRVGHAMLFLLFALLVLFLAAPLAALLVQSVEDRRGAFVGLDNFVAYMQTPALAQSLWNSI